MMLLVSSHPSQPQDRRLVGTCGLRKEHTCPHDICERLAPGRAPTGQASTAVQHAYPAGVNHLDAADAVAAQRAPLQTTPRVCARAARVAWDVPDCGFPSPGAVPQAPAGWPMERRCRKPHRRVACACVPAIPARAAYWTYKTEPGIPRPSPRPFDKFCQSFMLRSCGDHACQPQEGNI
jgi:hypothetical protein